MNIPSQWTTSRRRLLAAPFVLGLAAPVAAVAPVAVAAPTPDPTDPNLKQTVSASEKVDPSPAEVGAGHVDLGPRLVDGKLVLMGRDDTVSPQVWRPLDQLVLRVNDKALLDVPADPAYDFLGVEKGTRVHVVPQTELPGVLWLGWNTQDPQIVSTIGRGADLVLLRHQGPGRLNVFVANGFDAPLPLWDSRKPEEQKIFMQNNTHVHANWVFTEPGVHLVEVEVRATDQRTQKPLTARAVLHFAVGDDVNTEAAREEKLSGNDDTTPTATASLPGNSGSTGTTEAAGATTGPGASAAPVPGDAERSTVSPAVWGSAAAGAVAAAAAGAVAMRQRRARKQAWAEGDNSEGDDDA